MTVSQCYLFKNCLRHVPIERIKQDIPKSIRGLYVLYHRPRGGKKFNVVYIGMARGEKIAGIKGRLISHAKKKVGAWTHCSVFEVWDNITRSQVEELEAVFRFVYADDKNANRLNIQKKSALISGIQRKPENWLYTEPRANNE